MSKSTPENISTISIHALRGEGDKNVPCKTSLSTISIHALRGEGDKNCYTDKEKRSYFNPRPPWGGRQIKLRRRTDSRRISIHALRGEGDGRAFSASFNSFAISIHALRGEGDCKNIQICNIVFVHSAYKTIYFCDSCAFYLT